MGKKHEHLGKWDEELLVGLLRDEKKLRWGEKLLVGREESVGVRLERQARDQGE